MGNGLKKGYSSTTLFSVSSLLHYMILAHNLLNRCSPNPLKSVRIERGSFCKVGLAFTCSPKKLP